MSTPSAAPGPSPGGARESRRLFLFGALVVLALALALTGRRDESGIHIAAGSGAIPFAFVLFGLVLVGVALFHHHTLGVSLAGAVAITTYTVAFVPGFEWSPEQHLPGILGHALHEAEHTLLNLGGLLVGFALLAKEFEESGAPGRIPGFLPRHRFGATFALLAIVWVMSAFLDNIAAAMLGGVIARTVFQGRVTVGFLAAIVASSNAGGAWSVLGDTTTTMMWIGGVRPLEVVHAAVGSAVALVVLGVFGSLCQNRVQPVEHDVGAAKPPVDWVRLGIVALILVGAVSTNLLLDKPFVGVWAAIFVGAVFRRPAWSEVPAAAKGAVFLLSLVWCASLMPVKALPDPSWPNAMGLGLLSAVFDNIPLTKLALDQGGYDWGVLAFAVGFGGSMIWFGSSAGVALSKDFPEARSVARWVREGWFVGVAYVLGFLAMIWLVGWHPPAPRETVPEPLAPGVSPPGR